MKRLIPLLISLLLAGSVFAADDGGAKIFPYDVHTETLDNGLKVVLVPMSSGGLVAYWSVVRTGARDEYEPGRTGFAHFFEHMMFRGTEKYDADAFTAFITEIGADSNAFTSDDMTGYYMSVTSDVLDRVMDVESDRFQNLDYPKELFQTEAGAVYGEYRKNRTSPFFAIGEAVSKAAFEKHTYGHTAMGYEEDIKLMPSLFDYSKTFFSRYYRPENVILLITGDFEVEATMTKVREYYGGWERGYEAPKITPEPPQTAEKRITVDYEGRTLPIIQLAYKSDAFAPTDRQYVALGLFCDLAFGQTSPIYRKLVIEEQVVEFVFAGQSINRDPGLVSLLSRVKDPAKVDYVIAEFDRVLAEGMTTAPDEKRLQDLKSRLKYQFLMNLDTPQNVASAMSRYLAVAGNHESIDQYYQTADAITPEDITLAVKKYFVKERRTVAVLKGSQP